MANRITAMKMDERVYVSQEESRIEAERRMGEYLEVVERVYHHIKQHRPKILTALQKRASLKRVSRR